MTEIPKYTHYDRVSGISVSRRKQIKNSFQDGPINKYTNVRLSITLSVRVAFEK